MRGRHAVAALVLLIGAWPADAQAPWLDAHLAVPEGGGPIEAGPVPDGLSALDAAACGRCHTAHFAEWQGSAHARAAVNPLYLAEHAPRRRPFCARCHSPRGPAEVGIDCAACHVRGGFVVNPVVSGRAPHASRAADALARSQACARCHEFDFEGQPGVGLQTTLTEWRRSPHASTPCQGCHLPVAEDGHRLHHFPGGLDADLLRRAIHASSRLDSSSEGARLTLTLSVDGAGHAVPTGDVFRRLVVRAWPEGRPSEAVEARLARRFRLRSGRWIPRQDERIPPRGARTVTLDLPSATRVAWEVWLWRTIPERAERHGWAREGLRRLLAAGVSRHSTRGPASPQESRTGTPSARRTTTGNQAASSR